MNTSLNKKIIVYVKVFLIGLVVLLGLFLRLYLFPTNNTWLGDIGRDMLAGHLISFRGMDTNIGHYNSGIDFYYPSFYYYFIAFLTFLGSDSYEIIANILIFYQSFGIILVFLIIKKAFSYLPALVVSTFYALAGEFVYFSLMPITAHNSIVLILLSLFFLQISLDKKSLISLILSSIILILASTFFYGAIFLLPFYFLLILINPKLINSGNKAIFIFLLTFLLTAFLTFLISFGPITLWDQLQDKLFNSGLKQLNNELTLRVFFSKIFSRFELLHPRITNFALIFYFCTFTIGLSTRKQRPMTYVFAFVIFFHFLLYSLHKNPLGHYLIYVYIMLLFVMGYGLEIILKKNRLLFVIISIVLLISGGTFHNYPDDMNNQSYSYYKKVVEIIERNFPNKVIINYKTCLDYETNASDWESRTFWYFQRNEYYFYLNSNYNQIGASRNKVIFICEIIEGSPSNEPLLEFELEGRKYLVFEKLRQ